MTLRFRLRLLEPHRHEVLVGLGLGANIFLEARGKLKLPLKLFDFGPQLVGTHFFSVVTQFGALAALLLSRRCPRLAIHHLFQIAIPLEKGLHDLFCDEEPLFHVFFAQTCDVTLELLVVPNERFVLSESRRRSQHRILREAVGTTCHLVTVE